jgi:hypothetical protein
MVSAQVLNWDSIQPFKNTIITLKFSWMFHKHKIWTEPKHSDWTNWEQFHSFHRNYPSDRVWLKFCDSKSFGRNPANPAGKRAAGGDQVLAWWLCGEAVCMSVPAGGGGLIQFFWCFNKKNNWTTLIFFAQYSMKKIQELHNIKKWLFFNKTKLTNNNQCGYQYKPIK